MKKQTGVFWDAETVAWKCRIKGEVLPHTWQTKGAALAGLETERRRAADKLLRDNIKGTPAPAPKYWQWLCEHTQSHGIFDYAALAANFAETFGRPAPFGFYTVKTARQEIIDRGVGGYVTGNNSDRVCSGYAVACAIASDCLSFNPGAGYHGRGRQWQACIDALKAADL